MGITFKRSGQRPGECAVTNCKRPAQVATAGAPAVCAKHAAAIANVDSPLDLSPKKEDGVRQLALDEAREGEESLSQIASLPLETDDDEAFAAELLAEFKGRWKRLEERKRAATAPMLQAIEEVRSWFAPAQTFFLKCEEALKLRLAARREKLEAERAALVEEASAAAVAGDDAGAAEALALSAEVEPAKVAGLTFREQWDFEIDDPEQIPREYLLVDVPKIRRAVASSKGQVKIPGVRTFKKTQVASRSA